MVSKEINTVYMMGIGGIAMGTLATMLKEKGFHVVGSDINLYPPMSTHLEAMQIPVFQGYRAENLIESAPDIVIIGNVIRRDNPEAGYTLESGLPYLSMPQAIDRFFLTKHKTIVAAGTHGKSTTSSLMAWVLTHAGMDPSAFIGAFLIDWQQSCRLGNGPYMVLEGDEYDTAFFDKGPKFLHYRPHIGILTGIEFDHADIFANFDAVLDAFKRYVLLIPPEGRLIINADDPNCIALSRQCRGKVISYGTSEHADWRLLNINFSAEKVIIDYWNPETKRQESLVSKMPGRHNAYNALAVTAAASVAGLPPDKVQAALLDFKGITRRQEIVGECRGILVMDDFAHHPTAVRETVQAMRLFYPARRIIAAFEPRTNSSRRRVFQDDYASAFDHADCTCIKEPPALAAIPEDERLNTLQLVDEIGKRQKEAHYFKDVESLIAFLVPYCRSGDLVLCMSNGSFDGLHQRLIRALKDLP
ncbi:MAG: UDP-N-acetylmuramate--L-alanine ligase [Syntrophobacteraceae bacterium]